MMMGTFVNIHICLGTTYTPFSEILKHGLLVGMLFTIDTKLML